jgi:hypothetical protein
MVGMPFGVKKFAIGARDYRAARAIHMAKRAAAVSVTWRSFHSQFAFPGVLDLFCPKWGSATGPSASASPRLIPCPCSKWHRVAVGSRSPEFFIVPSAFVSPVPRSAAQRIQKAAFSVTLVVATKAHTIDAPETAGNRMHASVPGISG